MVVHFTVSIKIGVDDTREHVARIARGVPQVVLNITSPALLHGRLTQRLRSVLYAGAGIVPPTSPLSAQEVVLEQVARVETLVT